MPGTAMKRGMVWGALAKILLTLMILLMLLYIFSQFTEKSFLIIEKVQGWLGG